MAKLNSQGEICTGVAGGTVTANGTVYASPGGATIWLTDDVIAYQCYRPEYEALVTGGWLLEQTNVRTGARSVLQARGANSLVGGGGKWAAWLGGYGVFGSLGTLSAAGVVAGARDGTLAWVEDYQSGAGLILTAADGRKTTVAPPEVCYSAFITGPNAAIWLRNGAFCALNGALPDQIGAAWDPQAVQVGGDWWISYWCDEYGRVLHPYDSFEGFIIEATPHAFWTDTVALAGGVVRCVYSWDQSDTLASLRTKDFAVASDTRTTFTRSTTWTPPPASERTFTGNSTGGNGNGYPPERAPIASIPTGRVTREWLAWFQNVSGATSQTVAGKTSGSVTLAQLGTMPISTLLGRGSQIAGPPEIVRLGSGLAMQGAVLTAVPQDIGWYEPLTDGDVDATELVYFDGDVVMFWKANP